MSPTERGWSTRSAISSEDVYRSDACLLYRVTCFETQMTFADDFEGASWCLSSWHLLLPQNILPVSPSTEPWERRW